MKMHLPHLSFAALIAAGAFWLCAQQSAPTTSAVPSPAAPVTCCGAVRPFVEKADALESDLPPSADVLWRTPSSISPLAEFQRWADDYIADPSAEKAARGLALAAARRQEMLSLIKSDPALALANTVPLAVRRALPAEVQALLEDRIDAKGDYLTAGVSFAPGHATGVEPTIPTHVRLADGRMGGWADGRMGGWADGRMGGWAEIPCLHFWSARIPAAAAWSACPRHRVGWSTGSDGAAWPRDGARGAGGGEGHAGHGAVSCFRSSHGFERPGGGPAHRCGAEDLLRT